MRFTIIAFAIKHAINNNHFGLDVNFTRIDIKILEIVFASDWISRNPAKDCLENLIFIFLAQFFQQSSRAESGQMCSGLQDGHQEVLQVQDCSLTDGQTDTQTL